MKKKKMIGSSNPYEIVIQRKKNGKKQRKKERNME